MVLDLPSSYAIIVSAAVAVIYTLLGGFYSVAYTDVIQLVIIFISMVNTAYCKQPRVTRSKLVIRGTEVLFVWDNVGRASGVVNSNLGYLSY